MHGRHTPIASIILAAIIACPVGATEITLASAEMGFVNQAAGLSLTKDSLIGWRFELASGMQVTEVGGHLGGIDGGLFAAIVSLSAIDALPQGAPFTEAELVPGANATFTPPMPSDEVMVAFDEPVVLPPGAYALVFGAGQFRAAGRAMFPNSSQPNIPPTTVDSYISWKQTIGETFEWRAGSMTNLRFVVRGSDYAGPTDFNSDGQLDGDDLTEWKSGFGKRSGATITDGDADGDGDVDGADFLAWQRNIVSEPSDFAAVPEPRSISLVAAMLGFAVVKCLTQRRNGRTPANHANKREWIQEATFSNFGFQFFLLSFATTRVIRGQ